MWTPEYRNWRKYGPGGNVGHHLLSKLKSDNPPIYVVILKDAPTLKHHETKLSTMGVKKLPESDDLESIEEI